MTEIAKYTQETATKKYCLTILKDGIYQEMTDNEFDDFKKQCPEVAYILEDNALLSLIPRPQDSDTIQYDCWDKAAKSLIDNLWKCGDAKIFHNPVNPKVQNIPDYFKVIKEPMDFATIRQKLRHNKYTSMQDFINDIIKCFDNCLLFNGEDSPAGKKCMNVMEEFNKLYIQLNIDFYLDEIPLNTPLDELL